MDRAPVEKLVRDLIPALIARDGRNALVRQVSDAAVAPFVHRKVLEEAGELYEALRSGERGAIAAEMADLLEVLRRAASLVDLPWPAIEAEAESRRGERGGFERNILLGDPTGSAYRVFGGDRPPLLSALGDHLRRCRRASIAVSFGMRSGVELLGASISAALRRGASIRLLTSDYLDITEPEALEELLALRGDLALRLYHEPDRSFHAKCYIFEHEEGRHAAFVGSSNLSASALQDGIEWNYMVRETDDGWSILDLLRRFDALFSSPFARPITPELIAAYRARRRPRPPESAPSALPERPTPNAAQREALVELDRLRAEGERKALVIAATGVGKTLLAAFDSREFRRVLFLAHRQELLEQARASFARVREASCGMFVSGRREGDAELVFASVSTLCRAEHLSSFAPDHFDYIVVDEVHHAAAASYRTILNHFSPRFLLGLTATPYRGDNRDVFAICDGNVAYRVTFMEAIALGWLSPFQYWGIFDATDYEVVPWRRGRYDPEALGEAVATRDRAAAILATFSQHPSRAAIGFCASIAHARFMAAFFTENGVAAEAVYAGAGAPDRQGALDRLRGGATRVLFTVDLFNEGLDLPEIDMVLFLRPTESVTVFLQQLGRGLRLAPGKVGLTVLDFIGNYRRAHYKAPLIFGRLEDEPDRASLRKVLAEHAAGTLELPPGVEIRFEPRIIDLMREMAAKGEPRRERLIAAYREVTETLGRRPTLLEIQRLGRYDAKAYRQEFRSWFRFLAAVDAMSPGERRLEEQAGGFLAELEKSSMTRSYKMVVLRAFLELGGLAAPVPISSLAAAFRAHFAARPAHRRDLGPEIRAIRDVSDEALRAHLLRHPVAAWTGGNVAYFAHDRSTDTFAYIGPATDDMAGFAAAIGERAEFRLETYFEVRYERRQSQGPTSAAR